MNGISQHIFIVGNSTFLGDFMPTKKEVVDGKMHCSGCDTWSDENFQRCWALDNLRPLSVKQNMSKGARAGKRRPAIRIMRHYL